MKLTLLLVLLLSWSLLDAKALFGVDKITSYLTQDNPYVYEAIGQEYIYKEKEKYYLGDFDAKLLAKYDKKDYPASDGEYFNASLEKPLENGMEFSMGYRKAQGTQEYNNIKTSSEGEAIVAVKIPVFSVLNDMSQRKLNLNLATLDNVKFNYKSKDNLRLLYFKILTTYNKLLYSKSILNLENELLFRAKKRKVIIQKRVKAGTEPDISLLEVEQQIINRTQRIISQSNDFSTLLVDFVKYLNISKEAFEELYELPSMNEIEENVLNVDSAIDVALENRPDLKTFDYEIKKINLNQRQTNTLKYPKLNVSLYGAHDFKYENGFKIALDMDFPIERRKYEAKYVENEKSVKNIQNDKEKNIMNIKANVTNFLNSLHNLSSNMASAKDEIVLVEKLEEAENKKYSLGLSNLFMVNQREIYTLEIKKKLLKYKLDYLLLEQEVKTEIGETFEIMGTKQYD